MVKVGCFVVTRTGVRVSVRVRDPRTHVYKGMVHLRLRVRVKVTGRVRVRVEGLGSKGYSFGYD